MVDEFRIEANGFRLTFDNIRDDFADGSSTSVLGTVVVVSADPNSSLELSEVFLRFTDDLEFTRTRLRIKLIGLGQAFISRSEAKRIEDGLERFTEVELDFAKVIDVGQGFADELFRVWANAHPDTKLEATSMNDAVAFMVERAQAARRGRETGKL